MRILITNDDGIHAHGLAVLEGIAAQLSDDVWVVAPETDQSGVSHSLSLNDPLRLRKIAERRYAVKGTPTDCVIMGVRHILASHRPDLILSGVNHGQNVAEDVTYSGTVAGAMEGTILGVRSIALSQAYGPGNRDDIHWDCASAHGPHVIRRVLEAGFPRNTLVNINFPNCPPDDVAGTAATVQGQRNQELLRVEERADGRAKPYYWIAFARGKITPEEGTDLHALADRRISITPIHLDLTDKPTVTEFARVFGG
ncbi:MAG: 5'/3'-nucleotidase SurE [Beijerinckiaceae bacterium]